MSKGKVFILIICFCVMMLMGLSVSYMLNTYENKNEIFLSEDYADVAKGEYFLFVGSIALSDKTISISKSYLENTDGDKVVLKGRDKSSWGLHGEDWEAGGSFDVEQEGAYKFVCEGAVVENNFWMIPKKFTKLLVFVMIIMFSTILPLGGLCIYLLKDVVFFKRIFKGWFKFAGIGFGGDG